MIITRPIYRSYGTVNTPTFGPDCRNGTSPRGMSAGAGLVFSSAMVFCVLHDESLRRDAIGINVSDVSVMLLK